ncbi:MAG: uracil-DNA glycosylase [Chloroflexi bacterium]|nr:uracil-DNA glycosylase [Chloroflexota bacterium]
MDSAKAFVSMLAHAEQLPNCVNPYAHQNEQSQQRRHNLLLYLAEMQQRQPKLILIGEAPGYRGCRLTGIPFVSASILKNGINDLDLFGTSRGYYSENEWPQYQHEASSTIMWEVLQGLAITPLLWNVFPFHPHAQGNFQSNRAPTVKELAIGQEYFVALRGMFVKTAVIAIGNKADTALNRWQIPHDKVRHPSYGGKAEFTAGLTAHCSKIKAKMSSNLSSKVT